MDEQVVLEEILDGTQLAQRVIRRLATTTQPNTALRVLCTEIGLGDRQKNQFLNDKVMLEYINDLVRWKKNEYGDETADKAWLFDWWYPHIFEEFATVLLDEVGPKSLAENRPLTAFSGRKGDHWEFFCWFDTCPTVLLVDVLCSYMRSVASLFEGDGSQRRYRKRQGPTVLPVSYDLAGEMLQDRFASACHKEYENLITEIRNDIVDHGGNPESSMSFKALYALPDACAALPKDHPMHFSNCIPSMITSIVDRCICEEKHFVDVAAALFWKLASRGYAEVIATTIANLAVATNKDRSASISHILNSIPSTGDSMRKIISCLIVCWDGYDASDRKMAAAMLSLMPASSWDREDVKLLLGDVMITKTTLSLRLIRILVCYFDMLSGEMEEDILAHSLTKVSASWSNKNTVQSTSVQHQKSTSYFICYALETMGAERATSCSGIIRLLLSGISAHLESPRQHVRTAGMCVGNAVALCLNPEKPVIFTDIDSKNFFKVSGSSNLLGDLDSKNSNIRSELEKNACGDAESVRTETDSDDDTSDSEFSVFSEESRLSELEQEEEDASLQLQEIVKMLRESEKDWKSQLKALRNLEMLVRADPVELPIYAEALSRAVMYTRLPKWTDEEVVENQSGSTAENQRFHALVSLAVSAPREVGNVLIEAFYSPSSDVTQRARALQVLGSASQELSSPGSVLKPVTYQGAPIRLNTRKNPQGIGSVVLDWMSKLLTDCDVPRHGLDLFHRDYQLLGCLLCTIGTFILHSATSVESLYLCTAALRLINSSEIQGNPEVFVRRSALAAATQAIISAPVPAIAEPLRKRLLANRVDEGTGRGVVDTFLDLAAETNAWFAEQSSHGDETCRKLAQGGAHLFKRLTAQALEFSAQEGINNTTDPVQNLASYKIQHPSIRLPKGSIIEMP